LTARTPQNINNPNQKLRNPPHWQHKYKTQQENPIAKPQQKKLRKSDVKERNQPRELNKEFPSRRSNERLRKPNKTLRKSDSDAKLRRPTTAMQTRQN
jgi:hypothetical protein